MQTIRNILIYYGLGIGLSLLIIGLIHLFSLMAETYFCYAAWNNILITALTSGVPFGIAIRAFKNLMTTQYIRKNQLLYFRIGLSTKTS
jgi:hypothetical protein